MTAEEAGKILAIVFANYSEKFFNFTPENATAVAFTWAMAFKNVPQEIVQIAILKWVTTEKKPPKICEISEMISRTLYYEAKDALDSHKKYKHLSKEALAKYQYVFDVASQIRSNKTELTLSNFINNNGEYLLLESSGNERLLE